MKKIFLLILILNSLASFSQTDTAIDKFGRRVLNQFLNTLNITGNFKVAGSAGTAGQILTSGGAGAAASWGSSIAITGSISQVNTGLVFHNIITTTLPSANGRTYLQMGYGNSTPTFIGWQIGSNVDLNSTYDLHIRNARLGGTAMAIVVQDSTNNVGIGITIPTSKMHVEGSTAYSITTKTATYTATASDHTIVCNNSGAISINLPAAAGCSGRVYIIKKISAVSNDVTIDGNSSETIDGATTKVLTIQYESVTIQSNGTEWFILSSN